MRAAAAVTLLLALLVGSAAASWNRHRRRGTNTNDCLADLQDVPVCRQVDDQGVPVDLDACCDAVRQMAIDRCECNPIMPLLLGGPDAADQLYGLEDTCRSLPSQRRKWRRVRPREHRSCDRLQSRTKYEHGACAPVTDLQLDMQRFLSAIVGFGQVMRPAGLGCFNLTAMVGGFANIFTEDLEVYAPYGGGVYKGYQDAAEYLGIALTNLNHGFWARDSLGSSFGVSADGRTWSLRSLANHVLLRGLYTLESADTGQDITFRGCETKAHYYEIVATAGLALGIESIVQTAVLSDRWGIKDICRYHTAYCAPNNATKMYDSEQDCLDYMSTLPVYTEACGKNRPLKGRSIGCAWKHHIMLAANPTLHCPHIGPEGTADMNGQYKCDDTYECSEDEGQDEWFDVVAIGDDVPQELIDIFAVSNVGAETEPLPDLCP